MGVLLAAMGAPGCDNGRLASKPPWDTPAAPRPEQGGTPVPAPLNLLLPKAISIHPFTGTRTFDQTGGVRGIDVRITALDAYGDATKAFGKFHFALHEYRPNSPDPKGERIYTWEEDLLKPQKNLLHWDRITRTYEFKLQWYRPIEVGKRFLLIVSFSSPFTERKFAERVFVSGE